MGKQNKGAAQKTLDTYVGRRTETARGSSAPAAPHPNEMLEEDTPSAPTEPNNMEVKDMFLQLQRDIQRGMGSIEQKLDSQAIALQGLQTAVDTLKSKQTATEATTGALEGQMTEVMARLETAESRLGLLAGKLSDLEGRSRRNNVRVLGLDETFVRNSPRNMAREIEGLIRQLFPSEELSQQFVIERAHRIPPAPPRPGMPPRAVLFRVLNFRDRDTILRLARENAPINYQNGTLSFYPDFTKEVQEQRHAFDRVKRTLRQHERQYSMLFPARLRVVNGETALFFDSATEAESFVENNIGPLVEDPRGERSRRRGRGRRGRGNGGAQRPTQNNSEDRETETRSPRASSRSPPNLQNEE